MIVDIGSDNTKVYINANKVLEFPTLITYSYDHKHKIGKEALDNPLDSGILGGITKFLNDPDQYIWHKITPFIIIKDIFEYIINKIESDHCQIIIPHYFNNNAKKLLIKAAKYAGFINVKLVYSSIFHAFLKTF